MGLTCRAVTEALAVQPAQAVDLRSLIGRGEAHRRRALPQDTTLHRREDGRRRRRAIDLEVARPRRGVARAVDGLDIERVLALGQAAHSRARAIAAEVELTGHAGAAVPPFEWNFTRRDLADLIARVSDHEPRLRLAA
jgi:hypothetical protein